MGYIHQLHRNYIAIIFNLNIECESDFDGIGWFLTTDNDCEM